MGNAKSKTKPKMKNLFNKYGISLNTDPKSSGWFSQTKETTIEGKIIAEIFFIQHSVFEIKDIIIQVKRVKYGIIESFSLYAEHAKGSIFCKSNKVYITIYEDEKERESQKVTCAYDTLELSDFEVILDELHKNAKNSMSHVAISTQNLKYKVDDLLQINSIDDLIEMKYHSNSIYCIASDYRLDLCLNSDGLKSLIQNIRTHTIVSEQISNINELSNRLIEYLKLIRPNQNWRT
jgi:hypothetical protein